MDENQTPQQNGQTPPEPNQVPEPDMDQPQSAISSLPAPEQSDAS
jgi:hypothetical protein